MDSNEMKTIEEWAKEKKTADEILKGDYDPGRLGLRKKRKRKRIR